MGVYAVVLASDEVQDQVLVREVITAHSAFPTSVCLVGLAMFDLLEDSESHNGTTGGCSKYYMKL